MLSRRLALLSILLVPALGAQKGYLEVAEHGFKIRRPPAWREVPVQATERWILARFQSIKNRIGTNPKTRQTYEHRPVLRVIGFPRRTEAIQREKEDLGGIEFTTIRFPYRDYADYLRRNHPGGGYFISGEEKTKVGKVEATLVEYKFEKLSVPRRHMVMIYHLPERDLAVEVMVLETNYRKLRPSYLKYLRGLRPMEKAVAEGTTGGTTGDTAPKKPEKELTEEERKARRRERLRRRREKIIEKSKASLPAGWKTTETRELVIFTHASAKYTKRLIKLATQLRRWLDDNFEYVGDGEVQKTLLRICKDADEARLYSSASGDSYDFTTGEVVCAEGGGFLNFDFSNLAWSICQQYFHDKNEALWDALPWWIEGGIRSYVSSATTGRRGLEFRRSPDDTLRMRIRVKKNEMFSVRDFVSKPMEFKDQESMDAMTANQLFVRFLIEGPGRKGKLTKTLIRDYMGAVEATLEEMEDDWFRTRISSGEYKEPETEEEEAAEIKARRERSKQLGQEMKRNQEKRMTEWYDRTFEKWTDKDWAKVQKTFERWVARGR